MWDPHAAPEQMVAVAEVPTGAVGDVEAAAADVEEAGEATDSTACSTNVCVEHQNSSKSNFGSLSMIYA